MNQTPQKSCINQTNSGGVSSARKVFHSQTKSDSPLRKNICSEQQCRTYPNCPGGWGFYAACVVVFLLIASGDQIPIRTEFEVDHTVVLKSLHYRSGQYLILEDCLCCFYARMDQYWYAAQVQDLLHQLLISRSPVHRFPLFCSILDQFVWIPLRVNALSSSPLSRSILGRFNFVKKSKYLGLRTDTTGPGGS